jgi:hypothetical protein
MSQTPHPADDRLRLTVRSARILLLAFITGTVTGVLTFAAGQSLPEAILAALGATGGGLFFFDRLIAATPESAGPSEPRRRRRRRSRRHT